VRLAENAHCTPRRVLNIQVNSNYDMGRQFQSTHWTAQVVGVDAATPVQHNGMLDVVVIDATAPIQPTGMLDVVGVDAAALVQHTWTLHVPW
jgi:hypothetical protein